MKKGCLLSFVICGRNDDYLGNFKYRITSSINYLCRNAKRIGRIENIEIFVVDWNSKSPLSKELPLMPEACESVKFIVVPPGIALHYNLDGHVFNTTCAFNTGVRRANGKYIMIMSADILITAESLHSLFSLLEGKTHTVFDTEKTLINIERKIIPWPVGEAELVLEEWDRYLQLHAHQLDYKKNLLPGLPGGAGAMLLSKTLWENSQAFLENLGGWGWFDEELGLRINQSCPSVYSSNFGIVVYDISQSPKERENIKNYNPFVISLSSNTGKEEWGLKAHTLEIQKPVYKRSSKNELSGMKSKSVFLDRKSVFLDLIHNPVYKYVLKDLKGFRFLRIKAENEWACFFALLGLTKNKFPKKYLEYGIRATYTSAIVAERNPAVEIYGIDEWRPNEGEKYNSSPIYTSIILQERGLQGFVRYITGDKHTALERLNQSFIGPMSFDLVLFRVDMFGDKADFHLKKVMDCLGDKGALVVTGKERQLFTDICKYIQQEFPEYMYIVCMKYKTGIILKSRQDLNENLPDYEQEEKILSKSWKPAKPISFLYEILIAIYKVYAKFRSLKTWTV